MCVEIYSYVPICGILWFATCYRVHPLLGASVPLLSEKFRHFFLCFSLPLCTLPS